MARPGDERPGRHRAHAQALARRAATGGRSGPIGFPQAHAAATPKKAKAPAPEAAADALPGPERLRRRLRLGRAGGSGDLAGSVVDFLQASRSCLPVVRQGLRIVGEVR